MLGRLEGQAVIDFIRKHKQIMLDGELDFAAS
jgi:hypothetical protein